MNREQYQVSIDACVKFTGHVIDYDGSLDAFDTAASIAVAFSIQSNYRDKRVNVSFVNPDKPTENALAGYALNGEWQWRA